MRYILTLIIISLTVNANAQKNIYTPIYPLSVQYINKTGLDSNFNFFITQSFLDSNKASFSIATNANTVANTANTAANNSQTTANGAVQVNSNQAIILTTHTNQIASNKKTTDSIVSNWPSGGGGGIVIVPSRSITSSTTLTTNDVGKDIYINCSCTITLPQMQDGWYCWAWRKGNGTPTFKTTSGTILGTISVKGGLVKIASNGTTMNISVR